MAGSDATVRDTDSFANALNLLYRGGYLKRSQELQQELICEQVVHGQTDYELQKHLWVVMKTQTDHTLQTLIGLHIIFCSMGSPLIYIAQPEDIF